MLQLHQRFTKFSTTNFPKIFRGIIPEKHRYFPGNFRKNSAGNFRTHNPSCCYAAAERKSIQVEF